MDIETYAAEYPQLAAGSLPPLLGRVAHSGSVVELGAGEGSNLRLLLQQGVITSAVSLDLSLQRVRRACGVDTRLTGVVADACRVPLRDGCADGVIASQLIEHLPDPQALLAEIARILRPGGWWYIGSVVRAPRAWWIYDVEGVRRLDPTHVREYDDLEQFTAALAHPRLRIERVASHPVRYPAGDLASHLARRIDARLHTTTASWPWLRDLPGSVHPPGFSQVEAAGISLS